MKKTKEILLAEEFLSKTGANIFLTGKAGTGKTTFLREMSETLSKRMVVAAPTGVAAINARGVTLHSLFQLPFGVFRRGERMPLKRMGRNKLALIRSIEVLVIDEISMVRCDVLDGVDEVLRLVRRDKRPFGGVQLLMIGDVQQLAPICRDEEWMTLRETYPSPYFFESLALKECDYITIELTEIFRQSDRYFTELLNSVRDNNITPEVLKELNSRYCPDFNPSDEEGYVTLSTHNNSVSTINERKLAEISHDSFFYDAEISGDYSEWSYPTDTYLELKKGAQVIFIKNDISPEKLYYNGMLGKIVDITPTVVTVETESRTIDVSKVGWENIEYVVNDTTGKIEENVKGVFSQIPLKCAWAITIHKSQGLTFDRVIIDAGRSFAHGQVYVALSRCRTLEGMVLRTPLGGGAVVRDRVVDGFCSAISQNAPDEKLLGDYKRRYYADMLCEVFAFDNLSRLVDGYFSLAISILNSSDGELTVELRDLNFSLQKEVVDVGRNFQIQLRQAVESSECYTSDSFIADRLVKAAGYFIPRIESLSSAFSKAQKEVKTENKEIKKRLKKFEEELSDELLLKRSAMDVCDKGFSVEGYLTRKFEIVTHTKLGQKPLSGAGGKSSQTSSRNSSIVVPKEEASGEMLHPLLYEMLCDWRREKAEDMGVLAFMVFGNKVLEEVQRLLPTNPEELLLVRGISTKKLKQYGEAVLGVVCDYIENEGVDMRGHQSYLSQLVENSLAIRRAAKERRKEEAEALGLPKERKRANHEVSYELYKEGLAIDEIALRVGFTTGTIYNHLARYVKSGELSLFDFVSESRVSVILSASLQCADTSLKVVKEHLGEGYSYEEIRLVLGCSDLER